MQLYYFYFQVATRKGKKLNKRAIPAIVKIIKKKIKKKHRYSVSFKVEVISFYSLNIVVILEPLNLMSIVLIKWQMFALLVSRLNFVLFNRTLVLRISKERRYI